MVKICDCFPELKQTTEAREARYRTHPERPAPEGPQSFVEVKVTSIGQLNELVECKKSGHTFIISEPVHVGGQNVAPTPLEFMLAGAVGFYAAKMGVAYDSFEAMARSDFDVRGHMIEGAPSSAFQKVTIAMRIVSDAPEAVLKEVERLATAGCPGLNTLRDPVPVTTELAVIRTREAAA